MAATLTTAEIATEIAAVRAALSALNFASSYSLGGQTVTRSDIPSLTARLTAMIRLHKQTAATAQGSKSPGVAVAKFT